jgi:hypothetical protein
MQPIHKQPEFSVFLQSTLVFLGFFLLVFLIEGRIESKTVYKVALRQQNSITFLTRSQ